MTDDRLAKAALVIGRLKERIAALEQGEAAHAGPIAIVGAGCRFPGGAHGPAGYWALLDAGRDAVVPLADRWARVGEQQRADVPAWAGLLTAPVDGFDAEFFGVSPREAAALDPQHRLLLEVAWEALEDAGVAPHTLAGTRTGVFLGACVSDYAGLVARRLGDEQDAYAVTGNLLSVAAGRLAYTWGLQGPCMTVDTACSSSLVAVHLACRSLRSHESDVALAGGVNLLLSAQMMGALGRTQALSPEGRCKTFDALANGFARGEGCGVVVLRRLADAVRAGDRIWAVIRGSAVNQDGRSTGLTAPNVRAQEALLRDALRDARVAAADVGFIETHGTGTTLGDPIEVEALRAVLGAPRADGSRCVLGAVKTNLGHLEAAAGVAGLIKAMLALHHGRIPKNLHFRTLNPRVRLADSALALAEESIAWPRGERPRVAGVSAFGMSGTNAHVILEEAPAPAVAAAPHRSAELVVLSARSPAALDAAARRLHDQLAAGDNHRTSGDHRTSDNHHTFDDHHTLEDPGLGDLAFTLATTRSPLPHRLAVTASSRAALQAALAEAARGETPAAAARGRVTGERPRVVFVFPGQGGQWPGMARGLLAEEPVFRAIIAACDRAIADEAGWSLLATLADGVDLERIDRVQPALFAVEVALAGLWRAWGVEPDVVVGHSMGEVAAAHVAGALTLRDAVAVICRRAALLRRISGRGEMALVELPLAEARAAIADHAALLGVAVSNSPRSTVLSGDRDALATVLATLTERGVFCRRVKVDVASHSPQVDPLRPDLLAALADLRPQRATLAMRSTVTDAAIAGPELGADYWAANLREPVRFAAAVEALLRAGHRLFIEMSPHPVLTPAVQDMLDALAVPGAALGSLRREQPERAALLESLGAAWTHGLAPTWSAVFPSGGRRTPLPTYAWQHEPHWISGPVARRPEPDGRHPLLGASRTLSTLPGTRVWERAIDRAHLPWLADHRVRGVAVFPGAGYLEMMLAAGAEQLGEGPLAVQGATFVEALVLADEAVTVQVVTTAGQQLRVQVASETAGGWVVHAHATLRRIDADAAAIDLDATRDRLAAAEPGATIYTAMSAMGLDYGPAFQGLVKMHRGAGEALGLVALPASAGADAAYRLHPALLDACFHVMAGALAETHTGAWMPVEVGALHLLRRPTGPLWCHARLVASTSEDRRSADFVLVDEDGTPVAEVRGLVAQRLTGANHEADSWSLEAVWEPTPAPPRKLAPGRFVLLGDGDGLAAALHAALTAAGHTVVRAADDAPTSLADATAIVHLRSLDPADALESGAASLLATLQAIVDITPSPRLWLVTRGAQPVDGGDVAVEQAPQLGLARTIALEHPELRCACVDLDPARPGDEVHTLSTELLADADEQEVALRDHGRRVARLIRRPPDVVPRAAADVHIRGDRTYLVTGGLGGLGLGVAGWLAARGAGHLVLLGRSPPTEAQRITVATLAASTRVTVVQADVSLPAELAPILKTIEGSALPLAGVVHTAGVLDDAVLQQLDVPRLRAVMAAKARGALNLHALTRDLDLFVLYASGAGVLGAPGQANYAAANAVLDALAHHRRARGLPALSIDWGLFAGVGLAAAQAGRGARLVARGARSLNADEGLALLPRLLTAGHPQAIVVPLDLHAWAELVPAVATLARFAHLAPPRQAPEPSDDLARRLADAPSDARLPVALAWLRGQVARVLRLAEARVDEHTPLTGLGMDSLMGLELKHRLRRGAAVDVPMTRLLRDTTVAALARQIVEQAPGAAQPRPDSTAWMDIEL